ncbi:hypothetical protein SRB17_03520 [Streptomyces sp. RB17]|uniref:hypothetical protein n=1 Tax=Streptomyces sp. RB17 TaxID=2585197 RepID=UPI001295622D|nr:hypothetical protein [Streptomyces sp. RB17]MQY32404.1 hypothetical protein [Streptomyces sp. RB17]
MFSSKKIAAVAGFVGGLAVTCAGVAQAHVGWGPGPCTRDIQGNVTCIQRIQGEIPEDGNLPHQDNCLPTQPFTLPAALGNGTMRIGPEVTCAPTTSGAPDKADGKMEFPGLLS